MLLDLGRNDISRVTIPGTVHVTHKMYIEYFSHVMHIVSNIEGIINKNKTSTDVLFSGFPAGTVTGAPKIRAIEIIEQLEKDRRNIYAGSVGFISNSGNINTCIALRTAFIKNNYMYVQAGAGIVADSIPKNEFKETENKALALLTACEYANRLKNKMLILIDNYDSFTYNLVHYFEEIGQKVKVLRNDQSSSDDFKIKTSIFSYITRP